DNKSFFFSLAERVNGLGSQLLPSALLTGNYYRISIVAGLMNQAVKAPHVRRDADHPRLGWPRRLVRFRVHGLNRNKNLANSDGAKKKAEIEQPGYAALLTQLRSISAHPAAGIRP